MQNDPRRAKRPFGVVVEWVLYVRRGLKTQPRAHLSEPEVARFAGFLALHGSPQDQDATRIFNALRKLLLVPKRASQIRRILEQLPKDTIQLLKVAEAVEAFERFVPPHTNPRSRRFEFASFNVRTTLEVMLKLPDAEAYVEHVLNRSTLDDRKNYPGVVFHPQVFEYVKETVFRGLFSGRSDDQHIEQLRKKAEEIYS